MRTSIFKFASLVFCCALGLSYAAAAQETVLQLDPAKTTVSFTLSDVLHTVHGTFRLKSGTIQFDPSNGAASGDVIIDAASGNSGNGTRDKKMNKEILETSTYPTIEFLPKHVIGQVAPQGSSQVQVEGTFRLHGSDHDMTLTFPIQVSGQELSTSTHFEVPYEAWGLKNPSTLFLRVNNKVQIDIVSAGKLETDKAAQ
jgi:polyisoprenoid-binding protein YceI